MVLLDKVGEVGGAVYSFVGLIWRGFFVFFYGVKRRKGCLSNVSRECGSARTYTEKGDYPY